MACSPLFPQRPGSPQTRADRRGSRWARRDAAAAETAAPVPPASPAPPALSRPDPRETGFPPFSLSDGSSAADSTVRTRVGLKVRTLSSRRDRRLWPSQAQHAQRPEPAGHTASGSCGAGTGGGNALTPFPFPDTRETLPRARAVSAGPRRPRSRGGVRLATPLPESRAQRHVRDGRAGPRTLRAREARVQPLPRPRSGRGRAVSRAAGRTPPGVRLPTPQGALRRAPRHPHRPVQTRLAAGVPGPQHRI